MLAALSVGLIDGYLLRAATAPTAPVTAPTTMANPAPTPVVTAPTTTVTETVRASTTGTTTVLIGAPSGSPGSQLAAIVYRGRPGLVGGVDPLAGLGAFAVAAETTGKPVLEMVRQGSPT